MTHRNACEKLFFSRTDSHSSRLKRAEVINCTKTGEGRWRDASVETDIDLSLAFGSFSYQRPENLIEKYQLA